MDPEAQRARMVERQLRRRGIADERVLAAMGAVPREEFVPRRARKHAYDDGALPIGQAQTISQPWVVAAICAALELRGNESVLEVGTGSGYSACVLARLAAEVVTVERIRALARAAAERIGRLGVANVEVLCGDASAGLADRGPFTAIAVHAAAPGPPQGLLAQLRAGGRLVAPITDGGTDMLTVFRRGAHGEGVERTALAPCRFVRLVGAGGYSS